MSKPSNCPNCKGEREWFDVSKRIAECVFCGFRMKDEPKKPVVKPNICKIFSNIDILRIFEIANEALRDSEFFDKAAEDMELSDYDMQILRNKLYNYMQSDAAYLSP